MQDIMGAMRKAITDYNMIQDGDRVAVGVSGGKDSVATLVSLARLRRFCGIDYSLVAVVLDPQFGGVSADYSEIERLCGELEVPLDLRRTHIGEIIFDERHEPNPCSLCARMRRGLLHDTAKANGCNKLALGHNYEDAVETFMMNLFHEGRLGCFSPVTWMSRKQITVIRPLIYSHEKDILSAVKREGLPIVKSACPADKHTEREHVKELLTVLEREHGYRDLDALIFGAMQRSGINGWAPCGSSSRADGDAPCAAPPAE